MNNRIKTNMYLNFIHVQKQDHAYIRHIYSSHTKEQKIYILYHFTCAFLHIHIQNICFRVTNTFKFDKYSRQNAQTETQMQREKKFDIFVFKTHFKRNKIQYCEYDNDSNTEIIEYKHIHRHIMPLYIEENFVSAYKQYLINAVV